MKKFDSSKLKGKIFEVYGTQRAFAEHLGRTDNYVSLILSGKRTLDQETIAEWADALYINHKDLWLYFFTPAVHKE